jgi:hypothetical protein
MHNIALRTFAPRKLKTLMPVTFKCAYDPQAVADITVGFINVEQTITVFYPNGDTECFYGYVQKVEIDEHVEGTMPQGTMTVVPTNTDPSDGTEQLPVFTAKTGT